MVRLCGKTDVLSGSEFPKRPKAVWSGNNECSPCKLAKTWPHGKCNALCRSVPWSGAFENWIIVALQLPVSHLQPGYCPLYLLPSIPYLQAQLDPPLLEDKEPRHESG